MTRKGSTNTIVPLVVLLCAALGAALAGHTTESHVTGMFSGAKVNGGSVTHSGSGDHQVLTLSPDFKVPDTPAPHWQVVDSHGNVFLLQRLVIKDGTFNESITLPSYVHDVAKVQIWCAWAEVLLGEASFDKPVR